ncbi:transposase [Streptomyces hirsutus]
MTAPTEEAALDRFAEFADAWDRKYPAIVKLWENAWEEFTPFLRFNTEIRRIVCATCDPLSPFQPDGWLGCGP